MTPLAADVSRLQLFTTNKVAELEFSLEKNEPNLIRTKMK